MPPGDDATKGRAPAANLSAGELRRKKVQMIKLCACFAFAVKHYLRGEDGLEWADYVGILPPSAARLARPGHARGASAWTSYAATTSASPKQAASDSEDDGSIGSAVRPADATKRIRVKRSKDNLKQPGVKSPSPPNMKTPLLDALHQTIDFNADPDNLSMPLPLVYVVSHFTIILEIF